MGSILNPMLSQGYMNCVYPSGDFPLAFPPAFTAFSFQFHTVKAVQNLRRGLCCLPVGDNLITGHGAGRASRLPGPAHSLNMAGGPEHPSLLGPSPTGAWGSLHRPIHSMGSKASQPLLGLPCCWTGDARLWKMLV